MLVVTNGPVAIAGSISSFLRSNGIVEPTVTAIIIEEQMLKPTTRPRSGSASINLNFANSPSNTPYKRPRIKPT